MKIGIIGAGQAACTLIAELVSGQFSGKILVFNGESYRPYQRPPLSKTWLHNPTDIESIRLLPEPIETHASIEWIYDHVVSIEPDQGMIATENDRRTVDHIVMATGTRAKMFPIDGLPSDQVHVIRTLSDAIHLHEVLDKAHNIAIIGAGFLAFELASNLDCPERTIRVLAKGIRALPQISVIAANRLLEETPASIRVGVTIERYDQDSASLITNHGPVPADLVIMAIGAEPNTELASACGLGTSEGIPTDALMQTTHPRVSAIGEVSLHEQPHLNETIRIESISEANDSASTLAKRLLGAPEPFKATPWFWSDQGKLKLQIAGAAARNDDETSLIETQTEGVVIRHKGDHVTAIEAVNAAKEFMAARRLFEQGSISLNALLKAGSVFSLLQSSRS
ncbi:MAG: FAD-dependent oxidoreductase [Pseudomonadota bacterium]|nr:FAD-dependent oxidoreductase [Pseudomonadota bacterium]